MSAQYSSLLEVFETGGATGRRQDPVAAAFERGRAEGLTEGVLAGRAQGLEEGRAEGLEAGRAEGVEAGRVEGRAAASEDRDAALKAIAKNLAAASQDRAETERRFAASASATLRAAVASLLPRLAQRGLADEVAAIARELCAGAALGAATLRVAPDLEESARAALAEAGGADAEPIEVQADAQLRALCARLEWRDGFMVFDAEQAAADVLRRLDAALSSANDPIAAAGEAGAAEPAADLV